MSRWSERDKLKKLDPPEKPSDDIVSVGLFWIADTLEQWKPGYQKCFSTYCLKDLMERETKVYLTNGQFKWLMLKVGFSYKEFPIGEINWIFNVMFKRGNNRCPWEWSEPKDESKPLSGYPKNF